MDVIITDRKHPHFGEHGLLPDKDEQLEVIRVIGKQMVKLKLVNCAHGQDACYIAKGQASILPRR